MADSRGQKRKRVVLSLVDKTEIIKRLRNGETATKIALDYGIGRTTVNDIKKHQDKIEHHVSQMESVDGATKKRKTMKLAANEDLDSALYQWFVQNRTSGVPISGPLICAKAIELNAKLGGDLEFKASIGWLDKFKN